MKKKTLIISPLIKDFDWATLFCDADIDYKVINLKNINRRSWQMILDTIKIKEDLTQYNVIITIDYYIAAGLALKTLLSGGAQYQHIAWGFNKSRDSRIEQSAIINALLTRAFRHCDLFCVHSSHEIELFHKRFSINREKIIFRHWASNLPAVVDNKTLREKYSLPNEYFCSIGRNNRDHQLFIDALRDLDTSGVVVAPPEQIRQLSSSDNVQLLSNLPMDETLGIINGSLANILAIKDASRGAGHMTAVFAMQMKKPQIVTRVDTIKEYFIEGEHGLSYERGDLAGLKNCLRTLLSDNVARETFGDKAYHFSQKWLTKKSVDQSLKELIINSSNNQTISQMPKNWEY